MMPTRDRRKHGMEIKALTYDFSVCKVKTIDSKYMEQEFCFIGKTDEELSLVCQTEYAPTEFIESDDGWRAFRIQGILDFSLIGILAPIAQILADNKIGIFAVSTYNTDYVLVKKEIFQQALDVLKSSGYTIC
jgi:hypothetical protein